MSDSGTTGCITSVGAIKVGHWTDSTAMTGCTTVLVESGATAGVDVRGSFPGTRDCTMLDPGRAPVPVHAINLAGGSNLGLESASGVARWLEERGCGLRTGRAVVPRVPSAVIFDVGASRGSWPDVAAGWVACDSASAEPVVDSRAGAGCGARVGRLLGNHRAMRGGLATAAVDLGDATVGALMVANPFGGVYDRCGAILAGPRDPETGGVADCDRLLLQPGFELSFSTPGECTVIGVVATDAHLTPTEATRVAKMAQAGVARAVRPAYTDLDGDAVFCLSTAQRGRAEVTRLGHAAAVAVAEAINSAVRLSVDELRAGADPQSA